MARRYTDQHPKFFVNGAPASNGSIEYFNVGTTGASNRRNTFSDSLLTVINPNPIDLDENGRTKFSVFLRGEYNTVISDKNGVQIDQVDNVSIDTFTSNVFFGEDFATFQEAVTAAAGKELWISENTVVAANITVSGLTLRFIQGGNLDPNTGITVTLNCDAQAGDFEIFDKTAAGLINGTLVGGSVNVKWWGATGDAITDDRLACQRAVTFINSVGGGVVLFPTGTYLLTGVAGDDGTFHGINVPHSDTGTNGSAVSINLLGTGKDCILRGNTSGMLVVRWSASSSSMQGIQIDGNDLANDGLALVASDKDSTSLGTVDQSYNVFTNMFINKCNLNQIRLKVSKSSASSCLYNVFDKVHLLFKDLGTQGRGILLDWDTGDASTPNRNAFTNMQINDINTGIEIIRGSLNLFDNVILQAIDTGVTPNAIPTCIVVGSDSGNIFNKFINCASSTVSRNLDINNVNTLFFNNSFEQSPTSTDIIADSTQVLLYQRAGTDLIAFTAEGSATFNAGVKAGSFTTAELTAVANQVNTSDNKVNGYIVFNSTTSRYIYASGALDASTWLFMDGTLAHTPV